MSEPIYIIIGIPMFISLFYRVDYVRFLAPLWLAIYIIEQGFLWTAHGFIIAVACLVVAALIFYKYHAKRFFKQEDKNSDEADSSEEPSDNVSKAVSSPHNIKRYEGQLLAFGIANWKHNPDNDLSFYVNVNGKEVWAIGLKDALKACGANVGDHIAFWKENEVKTNKAQVLDRNGKVIGYRELNSETHRGIWRMVIID
ncbi:nickase [Photorhabdus sp. APURE]|uniref:nickase n=1 Tax=Photorhabdus aballayi TaxID=2991723 RepID=UPI00223D85CA|nr:nickase [Photorhabdus aballayi]MCW7549250.1 nickase [Photorhabdus aballayi]